MREPVRKRETAKKSDKNGAQREVTLRVVTPETGERKRRWNWKYIVPLAVVAVLALFLIARAILPATVTTVSVQPTPVTRTITSSGTVAGARQTPLGVDIAGVVDNIYTREGTRVSKGQLLLTLNTTNLDAQVNQSRQALQTAESQLAQVQAGPQAQEIQRLRSELAKAEQVGQANVQSAQAHLRDLQAGSRVTEIAQAQAEVRRLAATEIQSQNDLRRTRALVSQGALSQSDLDKAVATYNSAKESRIAAQQNLAQLRAGNRPQQIAQAKADLQSAQANYRNSVNSAQDALNALLAQPRPEDVRVAQDKVAEAQSALGTALDQREKAKIYAPYDGIVTQLSVESGQSINPGQQAMTLVEIGSPEIDVNLDEDNLSQVAVGQQAIVTVQSYPGARVMARVSEIYPRVDPEQGTVLVKLVPSTHPDWLRSNLTVDVSIIVASGQPAILLPIDAVKNVGGTTYVMVVENGRAVQREVVTGGAGPTGVVVLSGIKRGDRVVMNADSVANGERIFAR